jgi:hypothetical protein
LAHRPRIRFCRALKGEAVQHKHVEPEQHIIGWAEDAHMRTAVGLAKGLNDKNPQSSPSQKKHSLIIPVYRNLAANDSPRMARFPSGMRHSPEMGKLGSFLVHPRGFQNHNLVN